jgi:Formate hydrogenlyase subunit 4
MEAIQIICLTLYLILAPVGGFLLAGADRIVTARMQRRKGPPIMQPYYDVRKLMRKEASTVNGVQDFYVMCSMIAMIVTGGIFFAGGDLLLVIFTLTLSAVLLAVAAFSSNSPYAQIGAERELYMMMAYEPMVIFTVIGLYIVTGSFNVSDIIAGDRMPILYLAGIFLGFTFILTIKLRKSPFDLSMSHHAHQELVKGMTTEFSGKTLAMVEILHWYENILLLGIVFLFFCDGTLWACVLGIAVCVIVYVFEILIDNTFARMKWQVVLKSSWMIALIFGIGNIALLYLVGV